MKFYISNIVLVLLVILTSCEKEFEKTNDLVNLQVYPEIEGFPIATEANQGMFLILTEGSSFGLLSEGYYDLLMLENDGTIIKKIYSLENTLFYGDFWKIVSEPNNNFSIFYENGTRRLYNESGELIVETEKYLENLETIETSGGPNDPHKKYTPAEIILLENGNYFTYGYLSVLNRAFVSLHASDGTQIFKKFYISHLPEMNAFTGAAVLPDGNFLLVGCQPSSTPAETHKIFIVKYNQEGELINEVILDYGPGMTNDIFHYSETYIFTKELLSNADGTYSIVVNRPDPSEPNQYNELINIDEDGLVLGIEKLNALPNGIIKKVTTVPGLGHFGVVNLANNIPTWEAHDAHWFQLDVNGNYVAYQSIDRNSTNYLIDVVGLSDNSLAMVGGVQPFGDPKINTFLMLKKP